MTCPQTGEEWDGTTHAAKRGLTMQGWCTFTRRFAGANQKITSDFADTQDRAAKQKRKADRAAQRAEAAQRLAKMGTWAGGR